MAINNRSPAKLLRQVPAAPAFDRAIFVRPIAHRGLHSRSSSCIENTAPAFVAAIKKGYGIECDLRAARDATPMVFHDATLDRLVAGSGPIGLSSPARLARLRYRKQDTRILSFAELLELVNGRTPLLVEVKTNGRARQRFLEKVAAAALDYRGPLALMSFDRRAVMALGALAPTIPRGLVVGRHQLHARLWTKAKNGGESAAVSALLDAAPEDLSFFAVDVKLLPAAAEWMERRPTRLPLFSWTIRTAKEQAVAARWADAPIFEDFEPK